MSTKITAVAATLVVVAISATSAFAQKPAGANGVSQKSPGQQMQISTTSTAPGASESAPGHLMQDSATTTPPGKSADPGASGNTPGDTHSHGKK